MTPLWTQRLLLVVAILLALLYLFPLYWMYVTSLKTGSEIFATPPGFVPADPQWGVFGYVWGLRDMGRFLWNSVIIASGTMVLTALLGTGCAYVLARYRNMWIDVALFLVLMLQVLPASLMITPLFVGFSMAGLLNHPQLAVVLALTAKTMPFFVVLVRATFMSVPGELEEAAQVDGNSREFIYSKSIIQAVELQPASVGLNAFMGPNTTEWNNIMAYASIYVTPILAAFVLLQRRIVSGLTSGALK